MYRILSIHRNIPISSKITKGISVCKMSTQQDKDDCLKLFNNSIRISTDKSPQYIPPNTFNESKYSDCVGFNAAIMSTVTVNDIIYIIHHVRGEKKTSPKKYCGAGGRSEKEDTNTMSCILNRAITEYIEEAMVVVTPKELRYLCTTEITSRNKFTTHFHHDLGCMTPSEVGNTIAKWHPHKRYEFELHKLDNGNWYKLSPLSNLLCSQGRKQFVYGMWKPATLI